MSSDESFEEYLSAIRLLYADDQDATERQVQIHVYERQSEKLLLSLGIKRTAVDFINLLKDKDKLKEIVFKINNKAFL